MPFKITSEMLAKAYAWQIQREQHSLKIKKGLQFAKLSGKKLGRPSMPLPLKQAMIELRFYGKKSIREIASLLGVSSGAVFKVVSAVKKYEEKEDYLLSDTYIKGLICKGTKLSYKDIPEDMILAYRELLILKRLQKEDAWKQLKQSKT